jgi:hypothetical protein
MARGVGSFQLIALACFAPYARAFGDIAANGCSCTIPLTQTSLSFSTAAIETRWQLYAKDEDEEEEFTFDPNMPVIMRGSQEDEISTEVWENVDTGEPPKSVIMKEVSLVFKYSPSCFSFFKLISFSTVASWNQHFYIHTGRHHCCVSNAERCAWSWMARSNTWNEGSWHLYRCVHFVARHCRPERPRLSFIRNRDYLLDNAMSPRIKGE